MDHRYEIEITQDVKGQLRFLEDLEKLERKRHDEQEREMLIKAAKSRSKSEHPEQAKLKAKANEVCLKFVIENNTINTHFLLYRCKEWLWRRCDSGKPTKLPYKPSDPGRNPNSTVNHHPQQDLKVQCRR